MNIVLSILLVFFGLTAVETLYLFLFTLAGRLGKVPGPSPVSEAGRRRMAVLIPAYKEDFVIVDSARQALVQDYPQTHYEVIVIADSLQAATLRQLGELPVRVVEVSFEVSTKAKALNATMAQLEPGYEVAVVLDADNVMAPDFLTQVNAAFAGGWNVLQGHRVAKNTNTSVAILDAVSEEINTHIFRKGHRVLGLSGSLMGSGMAFDFALFRHYMNQINTTGGFDKELEMRLIRDQYCIEYLEDALCYDEKVQNLAVFEKQRARWIAAQIKYLRRNLLPGLGQLVRGNFDYFDKVFLTALLPRVILLGFLSIGTLLALVMRSPALIVLAGGQLVLLLFSFYLAVPKALMERVTWQEIRQLPAVFFRFLRSLTRIGEAGKRFIHTPHNTTGEAMNG